MSGEEHAKLMTLKQIVGEIPNIQLHKGNDHPSKTRRNKTMPEGVRFKHTRNERKAFTTTGRILQQERAWMYA